MLKSDLLNALIGDDYIDDPAQRDALVLPIIRQAIEDADAEIDGYLSKRYSVPLAKSPSSIAKNAKDIAVYNLVSRIGVGKDSDRESIYRERYRNAIRFLEMISKGVVELGISSPTKQAASGFRMGGSRRLFSRDSMKGM